MYDAVHNIMVRAVLARVGLSSYYQGPTRATAARLGEGAVNDPQGRSGIITTMEEYEARKLESEHANYCDATRCDCDLLF